MRQISIRFHDEHDAVLWAAIQAIPPGRRNTQLKQMLAAALSRDEVLQRLEALERRLAEWESGNGPIPAPSPAPLTSAPDPALTPPGWKESLAQFGAFED